VFHHGPCHPSFCSVFHHGPCFPYYLPPLGETLQLTIVSTNDNEPLKPAGAADKDAEPHALDTIREMFTALRGCWVPPPKDEARHGMEYTIRFAFKRDGELIAPPRMTYASPDVPADERGILSRRHRRGPQALHAAAFQQGHGWRHRRSPHSHPLRRRSHERYRPRRALTAHSRQGRKSSIEPRRRRQDAPPGHFWPGAGAFYGLSAFRRTSSGSLAKFAAMRRASSRVSRLFAERCCDAAICPQMGDKRKSLAHARK
jgi:hypothetical protein